MPTLSRSALSGDVRESIAIANLKSVAEQSSMLSNLAFANLLANVNLSQQNAIAAQQAGYQLALAVTGKAVNLVGNLSVREAVAVARIMRDRDLSRQIAELRAAVARLRAR